VLRAAPEATLAAGNPGQRAWRQATKDRSGAAALSLLGGIVLVAAGICLAASNEAAANVVASLVFMALALTLAWRASAPPRIAGLGFLFVVNYTVLVYIGSVVLYLSDGSSNPALIAGSLLAFSAGFDVAGARRRASLPDPRAVHARRLSNPTVLLMMILGSLVLSVLSFVAFREVGIPILGGGVRDIIHGYDLLNSATPRYTLVVLYDLPIALTLMVLAQAQFERSRGWLVLVAIMALLFSVTVAATSRRYPILYMAIAWLILLAPFRPRLTRARLAALLAAATVALTVYTWVGMARAIGQFDVATTGSYLTSFVDLLYNRVLYSQAHVVAVLLGLFPAAVPFFDGFTLADQFLRVPWTNPSFDFPHWLYPFLFEHFDQLGYAVAFAPPTLFGELYANFGPWLALVSMACWGGLCGLFERAVRPWAHQGQLRLAAYAMLSMFLVVSGTEGLESTVHSLVYSVALILLFVGAPVALSAATRHSHG